ncbi:helix-turn-helix transcriptional regulator [Streptomyces sp. MB09-02B]|uniref:helix-turn-helix domain-containing protein n=1 Tax=Streptomyces sp. MB09-02B TaxID=3028667 RepID=UPI0029B28BB8|nr:helix-turn-helix transcriptional regulator [Streptomyces sp. MB09-02B]MDX3643108.1 helix-turn-helix transcriptional regulator [Streptomyces sp. MB09-02B]
MPKPRTIDPSESTRAMYGAELRHRRERAGMSQEELGTAMFITGAHVGMLEVGTRRMQPEFAKTADEVLGADGFFTRNLEAARKSPYEHHFADVAEFEGLAHTIKDWAPILAFYECLCARADSLFELTDAVLCADGPVKTLGATRRTPSPHPRPILVGAFPQSAFRPAGSWCPAFCQQVRCLRSRRPSRGEGGRGPAQAGAHGRGQGRKPPTGEWRSPGHSLALHSATQQGCD